MEKADRRALLPEPAQPQAWSRHEAEAAFAEPLVEQLPIRVRFQKRRKARDARAHGERTLPLTGRVYISPRADTRSGPAPRARRARPTSAPAQPTSEHVGVPARRQRAHGARARRARRATAHTSRTRRARRPLGAVSRRLAARQRGTRTPSAGRGRARTRLRDAASGKRRTPRDMRAP